MTLDGSTEFYDFVSSLWNRKTLQEAHIVNINPDYYNRVLSLTEFLPSPHIRQRLWHIINNVYAQVNCPVCNKINKWHPDTRSYRSFCSNSCKAKGTIETRNNTCLERYGVTHYSKTSEFIDKCKETSSVKFGKEHYSQTDQYAKSYKETVLEKYGVSHIMHVDHIRTQIKNTNLEKYGVEHPWANKDIQDNIKNTNFEKYGTQYPSQSKDIQKKIKSTNLKKYGVEYYASSNESKLKTKETCLSRYNVPYSSQSHLTLDCLSKYNNKEWLTENHHILEKPVYVIADELGMSASHLCKIFHKLDIDIKHFFKSQPEIDLYEFIHTMQPDLTILVNDRKCISPHELDLYIPSLNLAIEYCGIFHHSEARLNGNNKYHLNKLTKCEDAGIRLIQIFEDEWINTPGIVKSVIRNMMGCCDKLYARKCDIRKVSHSDARIFYDANHLQGYKRSSINIGLYNDDILVSCMSFSKCKLPKYQYELTRFANITDTNIIGAASRLFKHFIKTYLPVSILSYCDRRLFTGKVYHKLGFELTSISSPNYFYFYQGKTTQLFTREVFQKSKLAKKLPMFDSTLTEWENMQNNKYNRIWDCGNMVFSWGVTNE